VPLGKTHTTGDRLALAFLGLCCILVIAGGFMDNNRESRNEWKDRFLAGEPIAVRFICGAEHSFDCRPIYVVTYSTQPHLCEHVSMGGEPDATGWCNADPSQGRFSITGAILDYNRFGAVTLASKLVGRLFVTAGPHGRPE
jgi:hypothetical protein